MILAFASDDNKGLDGVLSYHFGRCPFYTFVEIKGNEVRNVVVEPNPGAESHNPGDIPQYVAGKSANMVFAGGMGPRAQEWFTQLGVKPVIGIYGRIKDIVEQVIKEPIKTDTAMPSNHPHSEIHYEEGGNEAIDRLKKEVSHIREVIAELNERLRKLENK